MAIHLECLSAPHSGKHLALSAEKPVTIKTNKSEQEVGEVRVELLDGAVVLTNRSRMTCLVNGSPQARRVLHHDDRIHIGKQAFRMVVEDDQDGQKTDAFPPVEVDDVELGIPLVCSACDKPFVDLDRAQGWVSGNRRICRRCLSKGVKPSNLPDSGNSGEKHETKAIGASLSVDESATARSESDRQRHQRRLSASRLAQVDAPVKAGLFSKVGQVFSHRDERKRLDAVEQERRGLLEAAGRLALSDNNGFGLPDHLIAPLIKGATVSMRPKDFSLPGLERWRSLRERLTFLDAEIAALRTTLNLGSDPGVLAPSEHLRSDQVARQNHTFAMLDAMPTLDLESDGSFADTEEAAIEPKKPTAAAVPSPVAPAKPGRRISGGSDRRKPMRRRH